jgi:hypothetical protein
LNNKKEISKLLMRKKRQDPVFRKKCVEDTKEWRKNLRYEILSHYSGEQPKCVKCGFSDIRALCLDHINNDGAAHRRSLSNNSWRGGNAVGVYVDIRRRGFPEGYQILCHNCNRIKEVERNA